MNASKKLTSFSLFMILATSLVFSAASSLSSVLLTGNANAMPATVLSGPNTLRLSQQQFQSENNISSKPLIRYNPSTGPTSIGTTASAITSTPATNASTPNANQTKPSNPGVNLLGQINVRALKLMRPSTNVPVQVPFHPINRADFANAKRQAELNLIKPQIKVFSHQNTSNRTAATSNNRTAATSNSSPLSSSTQIAPLTSSSAGFDGLTESQAGNSYPPDVQLASGSTYVVEIVNIAGEVFTKQGSSASTFPLVTFFKVISTSDHIGDPKIIYDAISGRWFASLDDFTTHDVRIAVSTTNDPTGVWNIYRLGGFTNCPDQPIIGINDDKFAVSVNDFANSDCSGAFTGVQYYIVDKGDLVNGVASPRSILSQPDTSVASLHPVQSLSSTSTLFMVDDNSFIIGGGTILRLYSFTGTVPNVAKNVVSLNIQKTNVPPGALQPGTTTTLDTGDDRVQSAVWYQGKLWLTLGDACTPPGDATVRACIRLDQIDTTVNNVLQDFDKGDRGIYYFYPALSIEGSGNLDFIYGYSSTTTYPSLSASGQIVGTPIDTLDQPVALKSGSAVDTSGRYGDYFGAGVDPSNTNNVWVAGEYHSASQWSTFISAIATASHPTTLTLNTITSVPWSTTATVFGKLTDNAASGAGIGAKTITFTGTGAANLASVTTKTDGTFTAAGKAPSTIATGWTVQAHFAGDSTYKASNSNTQTYNTLKHTTHLALQSVVPNTPWSRPTSLPVTLTDTSNAGTALSGKTIHFTGTGVINVADKTTDSTGKATGTGTSPSSVATGWTYQAHFAGDSLYSAVNTLVHTYNTLKHTTSLTLVISPTSTTAHGTYSVSGKLMDTTISTALSGKTITFTATSPITINSQNTNTLGQYSVTGLVAPSIAGTYNIQSHFAGDSLHSAIDSPVRTLTVTTTSTAAATTTTSPSSSIPQSSTNNTGHGHTVQNAKLPPITITKGSTTNAHPSASKTPSSPGTPYPYRQPQQVPQIPFSQFPSQYSRPYQNQYPSNGGNGAQHYPTTGLNQQQQLLPIGNAGASQTVYENKTVVLDAKRSYDPNIGGTIITYQWTQLPTIGAVPVTLMGANTATPYFTAPKALFENTILAFSLRVMDNHGAVSTNPAVVYIMVKHITHNVPAITGGSIINQQQQQLPLPYLHGPIIHNQLAPPNTFYYPQQPLR
jgi:hypothetical protein